MDRDFYDRMQRLLEELDRHLQNLDRLAAERGNRPTDAHSPIAAVAGNASVAPIRFCKDCRFSELDTSPKERWICSHPTSRYQPKRSLVTGHLPEPFQLQCETAREFETEKRCGRGGRHWEQR
jgi:hypothetical protein